MQLFLCANNDTECICQVQEQCSNSTTGLSDKKTLLSPSAPCFDFGGRDWLWQSSGHEVLLHLTEFALSQPQWNIYPMQI